MTALASALLAACTVGPDYVRPTVPTPERFARSEQAVAIDAGANETAATGTGAIDTSATHTSAADTSAGNTIASPESDAQFWLGFNDPLLTRLVDDALTANHDLRIVLSRYDRANALLRNAKFDYLPTVTATANASDSRSSADQAPGVPRADRDAESYDAGIVAGWELDLFGRIRRNVEAQRADTAASAADLQAAQVAIVGEVARGYVELRGLQE
ncbi:MAG: TolC family protein, partial [Luteimonas sp.]|nr:TolC family protein [Luteimonas sp.]